MRNKFMMNYHIKKGSRTVETIKDSRVKIIIVIIALLFMVINTLIMSLLFNNQLINEYDKYLWNTKLILIINGICFALLLITLTFLKSLTIRNLFLIFLITHISSMCFFIIFDYGVETDFQIAQIITQKVLEGDLFTPYDPLPINNAWRMMPPMMIWWYTYNYWIYGLDEILWRIVNLLLEVGIVVVMIQMFHENSATEKGWKEENFKIGLTFYIFSFLPIVSILLYANLIAFPVLLGVLGFLFLLRSKKNPKNIYIAVFFFCVAALTEYFAAIWVLGILIILLFQKNFRRLLIVILEIIAVFCLFTLPFLINDAIGFFQRLLWQQSFYSISTSGSIWAINTYVYNWPELINYIPALIALILSVYYLHKNYKSENLMDHLILIICIFEFFSPAFSPWHFLWIFPLLCLNLIYSFRKFCIVNLFFLGFFLFFAFWLITAYLTYPGPLLPDIFATFSAIFDGYMDPLGYFIVYRLVGKLIVQMGFVYLNYSYTKSNKLILALLIPFITYYLLDIYLPVIY